MSFLKVSENQSVLTVSLNRPDVRNAFNPEMIQEITDLFVKTGGRQDLRAVVLRGEGKSFCAGGDLQWMQEMVHYNEAQNRADSEKLYAMFRAIQDCPTPVLGVVHGAAFGGALGLIAVCDQVVCDEKTQFCFSEVKLGIAPAVISSFVLHKISLGKIMPLMLSGRVFTAAEALHLGLVHMVAEEDAFADQAEVMVQSYMQAGPQAVRETKKLLLALGELSESGAKTRTTELIARLRVSSEGQEGLKSFLEKREPNWRAGQPAKGAR